jgi:hypothetical protein
MTARLLAEMKAEIRTNQERLQAKIEVKNENFEVHRGKIWSSQEEMKAGHEEMKVILEACQEKMEANPEEIKFAGENQEELMI